MATPQYPKRLIEVDLPIREISANARKDQNVKRGHLHSLHVWWATRPLASSRAVVLGAVLPDPADKFCSVEFRDNAREILKQITSNDLSNPLALRDAMLDFVTVFSAWENSSNPVLIDIADRLVKAANYTKPIVYDPFAGAGSIPFEALRIGATPYATDINPVPILLNKVAIEYLPEFGQTLLKAVENQGEKLLNAVTNTLHPFYGTEDKGEIPIAYIWARTIHCEGPGCGVELPLIGQPWLCQKSSGLVALLYKANHSQKSIIVDLYRPKTKTEFQKPIAKRFTATCPICGYTTPYKQVREQIRNKHGGTYDARLLAVISLGGDGRRNYRLPTDADYEALTKAEEAFSVAKLEVINGVHAVPDEPYPGWYSGVFNPGLWNISTWGGLFTKRQAVALLSIAKELRRLRGKIASEESSRLAEAVTTCLALAVSNMSHYLSSVSIWAKDGMISAFVQGSGMAMRPDFAEANPLMPKLVGGLRFSLEKVMDVLRKECHMVKECGTVQQASATNMPLPDDSVDYIVTDPPYYAAVPYSDLSDFCYVWLKRMLADVHPQLFGAQLTPKEEEIVAYYVQPKDREIKNGLYFERKMKQALEECRRVLKPNGLAVIIFAHKGTAGWEAMLNALVSAGWVVTASWPIDTERAARMRAKNSATLASSVHLVCRPRESSYDLVRVNEIGDWRDVLQELPRCIHDWMPRLAAEGVVGADAIFACLGPALEIFSRYTRVEKASGQIVNLNEYLEQVWAAVAKEALSLVFVGGDTSGFEPDARLTAMWLWTVNGSVSSDRSSQYIADSDLEDEEGSGGKTKLKGGFALEYDAARKIAQGLGAHLEKLAHLVEISGDQARLLPVAERTKYLFGKEEAEVSLRGRGKKNAVQGDLFNQLKEAVEEANWGANGAPKAGDSVLDRIHQGMILFAAGRGEALKRFLVEEGAGHDPSYWSLAQALSALYPNGTDEKRWVDGVLARKKLLGF